ncbi:MAG: AtpZ/AtpI family protein [Oligoflexia bacterium]|nr:AtpZ/AtpI family protein [Oligoflexia bacterium]
MSDLNDKNKFTQEVGAKAKRKQRARRNSSSHGVWFGLGMMGLIGWSVVVPTLLGAMLGIWLDNRHLGVRSGVHSWTLSLMIIGLIIGCLNAWYWVDKEDKEMRAEQEDDKDE